MVFRLFLKKKTNPIAQSIKNFLFFKFQLSTKLLKYHEQFTTTPSEPIDLRNDI